MQLLNTAASGLQAQMDRLDAISNNIANIDTAGYQRVDVSFADTLTQVYGQSPAINGLPDRLTPEGLSLGTGVYGLSGERYFDQGTYTQTQSPLDMAIQGDGFFTVEAPGGQVGYTRAGNFQASADSATGRFYLATPGGNRVLGTDGKPIDLTGIQLNTLQVSPNGTLTADTPQGNPVRVGQLSLAYVGVPSNALHSLGADIYGLNPGYQAVTNAAGGAASRLIGNVRGSTLEMSNVNLTQEMTNMIETQHDFQMSSQAINIADKMLGIADTIR